MWKAGYCLPSPASDANHFAPDSSLYLNIDRFERRPDLSYAGYALDDIMMKMTVIGCGDAWGSNGRSHTCFRLDTSGGCLLVDFGASAIVAWNRMGFDLREIDAIVISHLHGDHFGGLPFLLLQSQFEIRRTAPLAIYGPPGLRTRLDQALEVFFPGVAGRGWRFPLEIHEIEPGAPAEVLGLSLKTAQVVHASGAPSTAIRLSGRGKTFAYSGDTEWTPALTGIAEGADLFIVECYSGDRPVTGHVNWPTLEANLGVLKAKRVAVSHMSDSSLARAREMSRAGVIVLDDGLVIDL